ncbi:MAG: aspartate/glutamate racemase family protein [Acidobacteriaceae bacterium]|nr:aspartate/glutamate racemase family protein [Acidobacteriaceae bacterium]
MNSSKPRIVLLHATPVAMDPVQDSMKRLWADAEPINLLDDGLTIDRAKDGSVLSQELIERFVDLGRYAQQSVKADGILITCSAFGPAIDRLSNELSIPVVKPNEAMFEDAISAGGRIGMLATFAPAVSTMTQEFEDFVRTSHSSASLTTIVAAGAIDALRNGDAETHNRLVAERSQELTGFDAIMLAHFSTSRARAAVQERLAIPVLSAPDAAVKRIRSLVERS